MNDVQAEVRRPFQVFNVTERQVDSLWPLEGMGNLGQSISSHSYSWIPRAIPAAAHSSQSVLQLLLLCSIYCKEQHRRSQRFLGQAEPCCPHS